MKAPRLSALLWTAALLVGSVEPAPPLDRTLLEVPAQRLDQIDAQIAVLQAMQQQNQVLLAKLHRLDESAQVKLVQLGRTRKQNAAELAETRARLANNRALLLRNEANRADPGNPRRPELEAERARLNKDRLDLQADKKRLVGVRDQIEAERARMQLFRRQLEAETTQVRHFHVQMETQRMALQRARVPVEAAERARVQRTWEQIEAQKARLQRVQEQIEAHTPKSLQAVDELPGPSSSSGNPVPADRRLSVIQGHGAPDSSTQPRPGPGTKRPRLSVGTQTGITQQPDPSRVEAAKLPCKRDLVGCAQLSARAERYSDRHFSRLAERFGVDAVARDRWDMDLSDVRRKLGYERLTTESAQTQWSKLLGLGRDLELSKVGKSAVLSKLGKPAVLSKLGKSVLSKLAKATALGLVDPFWIAGVVHAFAVDMSALDRIAAVTAIVPGIGCLIQQAGDDVDTLMCLVGDALLFTPAWPVGIVTHILRAVRSFLLPPDMPEYHRVKARRDAAWTSFLYTSDHSLYAHLYSHPLAKGNLKPDYKGSFADKLNSSLVGETLGLLSRAAQTMGLVQAAAANSNNTKSVFSRDVLDVVVAQQVLDRQRRLLISIPWTLMRKHLPQLSIAASTYAAEFARNLTSEEMVHKYKEKLGHGPTETEVRARLHQMASRLKAEPLALPTLLGIAHVLGQSKGVEWLDPTVLSLQDYITSRHPDLSELQTQWLLVHHATQVARFLAGNVTEDQLSTTAYPGTAQDVRDFHVLTAIRLGRAYDVAKVSYGDGRLRNSPYDVAADPDFWTDFFHRPLVPPSAVLGRHDFVLAATGVSDAVADSVTSLHPAMRNESLTWSDVRKHLAKMEKRGKWHHMH